MSNYEGKDLEELMDFVENKPTGIFQIDASDEELEEIIKTVLLEYIKHDKLNNLEKFLRIVFDDSENHEKNMFIGNICYKYAPAYIIQIHVSHKPCISMDTIVQTTPKIMTNIFETYKKNKEAGRTKFNKSIIRFINKNFDAFNDNVFKKENTPVIYEIDWEYNDDVINFLNNLKDNGLLKNFNMLKLCENLIETFYDKGSSIPGVDSCYRNLFQLFSLESDEAITYIHNSFIGLIVDYPDSFLKDKNFKITEELIAHLYIKYRNRDETLLDIILKKILNSGKMSKDKMGEIIRKIDSMYFNKSKDNYSNQSIEYDDDEIN